MAEKVPSFTLPNQDGVEINSESLAGKYFVLYFYPKDSTPGCTTEAIGFSALKEQFEQANCTVLGISKDSVKSHKNFCTKQNLTISLLSDTEGSLIEPLGVWQLKKNYGKEYMGIVRTTILANPSGEIVKRWDSVKVAGHAETVLESVKAIQA